MDNASESRTLSVLSFQRLMKAQGMLSQFEFSFSTKSDYVIFKNSSKAVYKLSILPADFGTITVILPKIFYIEKMTISPDLACGFVRKEGRTDSLGDMEYVYQLMQINGKMVKKVEIQIVSSSPLPHYLGRVDWAPVDKALTVVWNNNLYFAEDPTKVLPFKCISCKLENGRVYGKFIGYYKTDIFQSNKAVWWNADSSRLAFMASRIQQDMLVPVEQFDHDGLYSRFANVSYSRAAQSSPPINVTLFVSVISSSDLIQVPIGASVDYREHYIVSVKWISEKTLLIAVLARDQKHITLLLCSGPNLSCFIVFVQSVSYGWIDIRDYQNILFDEQQQKLILATPPSDMYSSVRQICVINVLNGKKRWLSYEENLLIMELRHFNAITRELFYIALESRINEQHLYRTSLAETSAVAVRDCITCHPSINCTLNRAYFSPHRSIPVYVHSCVGPDPRTFTLRQISQGTPLLPTVPLETNRALRTFLENMSMPTITYETVFINSVQDGQYSIYAKIHRPFHLNPLHVTKYPVLIMLSRHPLNQEVLADFDLGYTEFVVSALHYIVIEIDPRSSSSGYGFHFRASSLGRNLGQADIYDIWHGVRNLLHKFHYMDNRSIAVIGSQYGGYLALQMLQQSEDFPNFRCGIAHDPVTDFKSYDSFFSERFLQEYKENKVAYDKSRLKATPNMLGKEVLIIQNMNTDGILFDSSSKFLKDMIRHNVLYDFMPLYSRSQNKVDWTSDEYVMKKMSSFLVNCVNKTSSIYSILRNTSIHAM